MLAVYGHLSSPAISVKADSINFFFIFIFHNGRIYGVCLYVYVCMCFSVYRLHSRLVIIALISLAGGLRVRFGPAALSVNPVERSYRRRDVEYINL